MVKALILTLVLLAGGCGGRECLRDQSGPLPPSAETLRLQNGEPLADSVRDCVAKRGAAGLNVLALSGGGQKGAFGAGFLKGWSARQNRPVFDIVTGISTGALISTLAFLGKDYDAELEEVYTKTTKDDIMSERSFL